MESQKAIAKAFSTGMFEMAFTYLHNDIQWNIIGDKIISGKEHVISFCNQTAQYFSEVTTRFEISNVVEDMHAVAVEGSAVFINKEKKATTIFSCDVYRFQKGMLLEITSYCIAKNVPEN